MIFAVATLSELYQDTRDIENICLSRGYSVAEQLPYFMGELTPSLHEIEIAKILYSKRIATSQWRQLDFFSEPAQNYRTACAIVADQSDDLERLLESQFKIKVGKPAPKTPLRDVLRKHLLGTSTAGSVEIWARPLRFYPHRELVEFRLTTDTETFPLRFVCVDRAYWDATPIIAVPLTEKSPPIHEVNAFVSRGAADEVFIDVAATDGSVEDYIKFFCAHVGSDDGYFQIVESADDFLPHSDDGPPKASTIYRSSEAVFIWLNAAAAGGAAGGGEQGTKPAAAAGDAAGGDKKGTKLVTLDTLKPMLLPLTRAATPAKEDENSAVFAASLIYADVFFNAVFRVFQNGTVDMVNDVARFDNRPLSLMAVRDPRRALTVLRSAVGSGS
jgi:hypothetical protein